MKAKMFPFKQEGTQMYLGTMSVADLLTIGKVDVWKQDDGKESGYQRAPETARTGKVARFLKSSPKPLMPTSVLLSCRGRLKTEGDENSLSTIDIPDDTTLWIVDGQHRIYGFKRAINELGLERFKDYVLPTVIVEFPSVEDEANQFRVINETMKKIRTDLARRILAVKAATLGGRRELGDADRLWEATAVEILKSLSSSDDSPWAGRIQPPNSRKESAHVVRELSFITSLKPILREWPYKTWSTERIANALKAYWRAWQFLIPEAFEQPQEYVIMKTPGIFSLHLLARQVLEVLRIRGVTTPKESDFLNILRDLGDYATARYWEKDNENGAALAGSMKGFAILADAMIEEMREHGHTAE